MTSLSRTGIEYLEFCWNPTPGCDGNRCDVRYCWARDQLRRQKQRCGKCYKFIPHFHEERLYQPLSRKKAAIIGVSFTGELFCQPRKVVTQIIEVMEACPQHTFVVLTKQPHRVKYNFPPNVWFGVTVNRYENLWRVKALDDINARIKFISLEPLYERIPLDGIEIDWINWIIVGAETRGPKITFMPEREWVEELICEARKHGIAVFLKDNLNWNEPIRKYPRRT